LFISSVRYLCGTYILTEDEHFGSFLFEVSFYTIIRTLSVNKGVNLYDGVAYDKSSQTQYTQGNKLVSNTNVFDDDSILDVGCGNGKTTIELFKKNRNVKIDAFDLSDSQIEIAVKNRNKNGISEKEINFFSYDAFDISYNDKYSLIFSNATLHWITKSEEMYTKIFKALKYGGRIAIHQGGKGSYYGLHEVVVHAIANLELTKYFENWEYPIFYPSKFEMENMLTKIGFTDINIESVKTDGKEYANLKENFMNASFHPYLDKLPSKYHEELKKEYLRVCESEMVDTYSHRLYIYAKKGYSAK